MPCYNLIPVVTPSDLKHPMASHVIEAVREGTACLIGFESQGCALRLLLARECTQAPKDTVRAEPIRKWASLADMVEERAYWGA